MSVLKRLMSFSYSVGIKFSWLMIFSTDLTYVGLVIKSFRRLIIYQFLPDLSCVMVVDVQEAPDQVEAGVGLIVDVLGAVGSGQGPSVVD